MTRLTALALAVLALAAVAARDATALTLSFAPSTIAAGPGDSFLVDVVVSDLGTDVVAAFDLDVLYNPAALNATSVAFGVSLGDISALEAFADFDLTAPGTVDFAELSLLDPADLELLQTSTFTLATLGFDVIGPGGSTLSFLLDRDNLLVGPSGDALDVVAREGSVVAVVPEPGATLLFAVGFVLAGLRTRRTRAV